jgi:hypothetical protein
MSSSENAAKVSTDHGDGKRASWGLQSAWRVLNHASSPRTRIRRTAAHHRVADTYLHQQVRVPDPFTTRGDWTKAARRVR